MRKCVASMPKLPLWSLPACLLALLAFSTAPAEAQIQLSCHADRPFHPSTSNGQPQFQDVDVLLPITSSDPEIATGKRARVGGGTDGGIEIAAHGKEGDATITYKVKDPSSGAITTVTVQVHVKCPPNRTPTHRQTNCQACKADAARLNAAIDKLSQAQAQGNQTRINQLEEEIRKLTKKLDDCERKHCPEKENQPPGKGGGL